MRRSLWINVLGIVICLVSVIFVIPVVLTFTNAFKTLPEFVNPFYDLPKTWSTQNFSQVIQITHLGVAAFNSLIVTVISVVGIVWIASLAGYAIARYKSKYNRLLYVIFVSGMILPFHVIMVPSVKILSFLHLGGQVGLIVMYWSLGMSLAVFLFTGFIRSSIPKEIEESMFIDGASTFRVYWHIVVPLLKPILMTVSILDAIWIWNDFLLPSLLLPNDSDWTLPLSQFRFVGQYTQQWNYQFAGFSLSVIPLIVFFIVFQKYMIKGITEGSLKG